MAIANIAIGGIRTVKRMKLMIDISNSTYEAIMARDWKNVGWLFSEEIKAIHDGIPIPDNATNGDILKTLIPMDCYGEEAERFYRYIEYDYSKWWNAPYKKESEE